MHDHMGESSNFKGVSKTGPRRWVKRPLVLVVLALMLGLAGAAWGFQISRVSIVAVLIGLLAILLWLFLLGSFQGSQDQREGRQ